MYIHDTSYRKATDLQLGGKRSKSCPGNRTFCIFGGFSLALPHKCQKSTFKHATPTSFHITSNFNKTSHADSHAEV